MAVTFTEINRYGFSFDILNIRVNPIVGDTNFNPVYSGYPINIIANISSTNGIKTAKVFYKNSSEQTYTKSVLMSLDDTAPKLYKWGNPYYNCVIPAKDIGNESINYYLEVEDNTSVKTNSITYIVNTVTSPDNLKSPLWAHNLRWGFWQTIIQEDLGKLSLLGSNIQVNTNDNSWGDIGGHVLETTDLVNWDVVSYNKLGSIYNKPIPTLQGNKWMFILAYGDTDRTPTSYTQESRLFYHLSNEPYISMPPDYTQKMGATNTDSVWTAFQSSSHYGTPTGDLWIQKHFFANKPVIKDDYLYFPTWINKSAALRGQTIPSQDVISILRIIRIKIADLLLGKQWETFKELVGGIYSSCSETTLIEDNNGIYVITRTDGAANNFTYVIYMDWATQTWTDPYKLGEGQPARGFADLDGTIYLAVSQRDYRQWYPTSDAQKTQENGQVTYLYRHLPSKAWNQWEPREYIGKMENAYNPQKGYADFAYGYADVTRFKGNLFYFYSGGLYKVLDQYYKAPISISTPILTLTNTTLTASATITGATATPQFFYSTDNVTFNPMPAATDMGSGQWQSQINLLGIYGTIYVKVIVTDNSILYESLTSSIIKSVVLTTATLISDISSLQSFNTYNIGFDGNKKIGYLKFDSQYTDSTDVVALEYSTDQVNWTYNQLYEIPNNKYCKINLNGSDKYYFRFSILHEMDYFYSNVITSDNFYSSPLFYNQQYIKLPDKDYFWLTCDLKNLYGNENNFKWQISQDQSLWTDLNIDYINSGQRTYRSKFITTGKSGQWFYKLKLSRLDEVYYSDIQSFNLDEMYARNVAGYNHLLPKNATNYDSSLLSKFKLGTVKLGYIKKDPRSISVLGGFKLGQRTLGSFVIVDIMFKTTMDFTRRYSINVPTKAMHNLLQYYTKNVGVQVPFGLTKADKLVKLLSEINSEINIESQNIQDINIKCINNLEVSIESLINKEVEISPEMQFEIQIEAR